MTQRKGELKGGYAMCEHGIDVSVLVSCSVAKIVKLGPCLFRWVLDEVTALGALHSWVLKKLILKPKKLSVFHLQYTNEIFIQHVSITSRQTEACVQWYNDVMTAIMEQVCQVGEDSAGTGRTGSFKDTTRYLEWCWLLKLPKEPWVIYNSFLSSSQIPSTHALPPCLPMSGTVVAWR